MHAFVLVNVNVYTKFDVPGFTRSTDMTGITKFKIGHVTLTKAPFRGGLSFLSQDLL